jgi:hypothetical protein
VLLAEAGTPANEIVVEASCTFVGPMQRRELKGVDLHVIGRVPGLDAAAFAVAAAAARLQVLRSAETSIGLFSALTLDRSRSCEGRRSLAV